jgi:hypothetical protein
MKSSKPICAAELSARKNRRVDDGKRKAPDEKSGGYMWFRD